MDTLLSMVCKAKTTAELVIGSLINHLQLVFMNIQRLWAKNRSIDLSGVLKTEGRDSSKVSNLATGGYV